MNLAPTADWRFLPERVSQPRRESLAVCVPFDRVVELVVEEATGVTYRVRRGSIEAKGCTRAEFLFTVSSNTFDLFFNGVTGYRAQFYNDHRFGVGQNREVVERITPHLLATAKNAAQGSDFSLERVAASLRADSAKIWIHESESTLAQDSIDADALVAISVPHWVASAREVTAAMRRGVKPQPSSKEKALLGVQAPEGTQLQVLGAWLNDVTGAEHVVPSKRNRGREIRVYGFA